MNNYNEILDRHGNGSMKWERAYIKKRFEVDSDDIYPLFIADMDFKMDETIHQNMLALLQDCDLGYYHVQQSYYDAIIRWHQQVHHSNIEQEWILPSVGTISSLHIACDCYARGKGIGSFTPVYGSFGGCMALGTPVYCPLQIKNGLYSMDFDYLRKKMAEGEIHCFLLCNPHNPGGRVWTREELRQLVSLCKEFDVFLFSDEIHADLCLQGEFVSLIEFASEYHRIVVASSANKTFNISGLCSSYILCADASMKAEISAYHDRLHLSANRFGVEMTRIAYTYGEPRLQELRNVISSNMDIVRKACDDLNIDVMEPQAGYLIWMRLNEITDIDQFVLDLAKETHVLVERGSRFIDHYDKYIRINVATSPDLLKEAMDRFAAFYRKQS